MRSPHRPACAVGPLGPVLAGLQLRAPSIARLLAVAAAVATTTLAAAAPSIAALPDPTRPPGLPAAVHAAAPPSARGVVNPAPTAAASAPAASALPQLQSLQLAHQGPATAVLDGQLVRAGDRIGERTVVAIDHQGLLLRHAVTQSTERLQLLGGAVKQLPGSITITRHASFTPATPAAPTTDGPLTLAGRTTP